MEEEPGPDLQLIAFPEHVAHLLLHPLVVRRVSRSGQQHRARPPVDDEEDIRGLEPGDGPHFLGEEVGAEQHICVAGQEFAPTQAAPFWRGWEPVPSQDISDAALRDLDPKLLQLGGDPFLAPPRHTSHSARQILNLRRHAWPTWLLFLTI